MNPEGLFFSETHEWVHVQEDGGDKIGVVGISAFAVEQLNDLVYIELPAEGRQLVAGAEFGEVESVKAVSPLYCPVGGEILEVNQTLADNVEVLNSDPYGQGWILKVRLSDDGDLSKLLDYAAYQKQCAESQ